MPTSPTRTDEPVTRAAYRVRRPDTEWPLGKAIWDVLREEYPSSHPQSFDDLPKGNRRVWNRAARTVVRAYLRRLRPALVRVDRGTK